MILWCLQFWGRSKVEGRFPAWLSRVVPKCRSEPVYFVSFFTQEKKKGQSTEVPGPGLLVSRRSRAAPHPRPTVAAPVQGSPGQSGVATSKPSTAAGLGGSVIFTTAAHVLPHHVSQPTGGIRNSKLSKQFQYFEYICWIL